MNKDSKNFIQRPKCNFLIGMIAGSMLGLSLGYILTVISVDSQGGVVYEVCLIFIGAVLGVLLDLLVPAIIAHVKKVQSLNPLKSILGTIYTEDTWIYIHPWKRDVYKSELRTIDSENIDTPSIIGSPIVFGEGDSLALALIL